MEIADKIRQVIGGSALGSVALVVLSILSGFAVKLTGNVVPDVLYKFIIGGVVAAIVLSFVYFAWDHF